MINNDTSLTSSEIASLWTAYLNDSMAKCILKFMLIHIEDDEIKEAVQMAYEMSSTHLEHLEFLFEQEKFQTPIGFSNDDLNINEPKLYTDTFCLSYINHMARVGLLAYSGFLAMSAREDIRKYFTGGLNETASLFNKSSRKLLNKGIFVRSPYISVPEKTDFVDNKEYLSGLNPFTQPRALNSIEISHLFMNIQTNLIGSKLSLSFARNAKSGEVQQFMLKGNHISEKHMKIFSSTLLDSHITAPMSSDICLTTSSSSPFSDKLMMFHMSLLSAAGTGNYATAAAASQRSDLALNYERLSLEIGKFAKQGADIMIKNSWLEQPPISQRNIME